MKISRKKMARIFAISALWVTLFSDVFPILVYASTQGVTSENGVEIAVVEESDSELSELPEREVESQEGDISTPSTEDETPADESIEMEDLDETSVEELAEDISVWLQSETEQYGAEVGVEYIFSELNDTKVMFNSLPAESGTIYVTEDEVTAVIEDVDTEVTLFGMNSDINIEGLEYTIYLQRTNDGTDSSIEVLYTEDRVSYVVVSSIDSADGFVKVSGLTSWGEYSIVEKNVQDEVDTSADIDAEESETSERVIAGVGSDPIVIYWRDHVNYYDDILEMYVDVENEIDPTDPITDITYEFMGTSVSGSFSNIHIEPSYHCLNYGAPSGDLGSANCVLAFEYIDIYYFEPGPYDLEVCAYDESGDSACITKTVSVERPVANDLGNMTYDEGDTLDFTVVADSYWDVAAYVEMKITLSDGTLLTDWTYLDVFLGTDIGGDQYLMFDEETLFLSDVWDSSVLPEGTYEFRYVIIDNWNSWSNSYYTSQDNVIDMGAVGWNLDSNGDGQSHDPMATAYYFNIDVNNVAPQVNLGSDQTIIETEAATFTGSFSDPSYLVSSPFYGGGENDPDDADWTAIVNYGEGDPDVDLGTFAQPGSIVIPDYSYTSLGTFTVTLVICEADYSISSSVGDIVWGDGECTLETVTVTVNESVPVVSIDANPGLTVLEGTDVTLTARTFGYDTPMTYEWTGDPVCDGETGTTVVVPGVTGTYTCTVTATDSDGDTDSETVTVTVNDNPPIVNITANPGLTVEEGTNVTLTADITNGNSPFTYSWSGDCSGASSSVVIPGNTGIYTCTVIVTDKDGDTDTDTVTVTVNESVPVVSIDADPGLTVEEGTDVTLTASATGYDTPITYLWTGDCSGTPDVVVVPGVTGIYTCTVTATDSDGDTDSETVTVTVNESIPVVTVSAYPGFTVTEGTSVILAASATGYDTPMTYLWTGDCSGTSNIVVVPGITGTYICTVTVTDSDGDTDSETVTVTVNNNPPVVNISANPGLTVSEGTNVVLTANVSNGDSPYTYLWSGDCSGSSNTATVAGNTGTYTCTVTVTDSDGDIDTDTVIVTVNAIPVPPTPEPDQNPYWATPVEAEEEVDEDSDTEEDVLGEEDEEDSCESKSRVSGYVYYDDNDNGERDEDENGIENVDVEVYYYSEDGDKVEVITVETDRNGYWEVDLCPGKYWVKVHTDTLPEDVEIDGDSKLEIEVEEDDMADIGFEVKDVKSSGWFKIWYCLVPLILLAAAVAIGVVIKNREEE